MMYAAVRTPKLCSKSPMTWINAAFTLMLSSFVIIIVITSSWLSSKCTLASPDDLCSLAVTMLGP